MKVSTPVLNAIALGAARVTPEVGDSDPRIDQTIQPVIKTLSQTSVVAGGVASVSDNSLLMSSASNIAASSAASTVTMATLSKGLYTLDLSIAARFVGTPAPNGQPDVYIDLVDEALTQSARLVFLFAQTLTAQSHVRRLRIAIPGTFLIRRQTAATGVGQTMEIAWGLSVEREL